MPRSAIGVSRPRLDSEAKVAGTLRYAADEAVPGLLHGRLVLSTEAHATIERVDIASALEVPGVVRVLTYEDLPLAGTEDARTYQPLADREALYVGQPVAIVLAETEAAAEDGVDRVAVDYTPLEPVLDLEAAMAVASPLARHGRQGGQSAGLGAHAPAAQASEALPEEELSANVAARHHYRHGDAASALASADVVVGGRFRTSWVYQAYLEPQIATAWVEPDGELVVRSSTQAIFYTQHELSKLYGLAVTQVRVAATPLGGGFGAKWLVIEPLVAGAALAAGRPVRLAMTRSEDLAAASPAPATIIDLRIGAHGDGRLAALTSRIVADTGAFSELSSDGITAVLVAGGYHWPAYEIASHGVLTNRVAAGSYRGPGAPPAAFALETLLDELAERLQIDPIELRLRNLAAEGEPMVDWGDWPAHGLRDCLEAVREHPLWRGRGDLPEGEGVGVGLGIWLGAKEAAGAFCRLDRDGGLTIVTGAVDMTGTATAFAAIAAETFGIDPASVRVRAADTASAPVSPGSGGSVVTYAIGKAVERAAGEARARVLALAAGELEADPADLEIVDGVVHPVGAPGRGLAVSELAERVYGLDSPDPPIAVDGSVVPSAYAPAAAVHLAHVRVDPETGQVRVLAYVASQDVGRALNPALVDGQIQGGVAQGIGWALLEELVHDEHGQLLTGSLLDYAVPSFDDVPEIETLLLEVPAPDGPFGARGVGEAPVIPVAAAIANAVAAATGLRLRALPMTSERLWRARGDGAAQP